MTLIPPNNSTQWWIAYDLRSEYLSSAKKAQRQWLAQRRVAVWWALRFRYQCVPIQMSLWRLRDNAQLEALRAQIGKWKAEYEQAGFPANFAIFPVSLPSKEGVQLFSDMEFNLLLDWLSGVQESIEKIRDAKRTTKKSHKALGSKVDLIATVLNQDYGKSHARWKEVEDLLLSISDDLLEVRTFIVDKGA